MASPILTSDKSEVRPPLRPAPDRAWRAVAWFGAIIAVIGFAEAAVYLYPWGFGSREWEFGMSAQLLGALPLPTMGMAALLAAVLALGNRRGLVTMGVLMVLIGLVTWALLILFMLVVPLALKAPAAAQPVMRQTIMRTTIAGVGFGLLYIGAAINSIVRATRSRS